MSLRMLKPSLGHLRGGLKLIDHRAPEQIVQRIDGNTLVALRKRCFRRCGGLCECPDCQAGYPLKLTLKSMELDHILPLYQGGTNAIENLRCLHIDCHKRISAAQATERAIGRRLWSDNL